MKRGGIGLFNESLRDISGYFKIIDAVSREYIQVTNFRGRINFLVKVKGNSIGHAYIDRY